MTSKTKKNWTSPSLTVYGDVTTQTKQIKLKRLGAGDDFGISGIADAFPAGIS